MATASVGHRITGDRTGQSNSRGVGWENVHVCVDDHSRVAFSETKPDEKAVSAIAFRDACKARGLCHIRTKPYTPKTNGKAERFIKTALNEWGYARAYQTLDQRADHLPEWIHSYNWHRPHGGLGSQAPFSRLPLSPGTTC